MAILNQKRILNLIPKVSAPVTIHVSQGDVGTEIEFTLVKGDEVFVNPGNVSASVHGVREDGANFGAFTCTLSGSKVTFPLHSEMTAVKGSALAEIVLVDNQGNKVGSANFGIMVEESVFPLGVTYDNDVSIYESILAYVQTIPSQVVNDYTSKINAEIAARKAGDVAESTARQSAINSLNSALANEISARTNADVQMNARIDGIVAPSGEAPSVAEVTDARIGVDGVTYPSLGTAIRTQVGDLRNALNQNPFTFEIGGGNRRLVSNDIEPPAKIRVTQTDSNYEFYFIEIDSAYNLIAEVPNDWTNDYTLDLTHRPEVKFIRMVMRKASNYTFSSITEGVSTLIIQYEPISSLCKKKYKDVTYFNRWEYGTFDNSGNELYESSKRIRTKDTYRVNRGARFKVNSPYQFKIESYTDFGEFKGETGWKTEYIVSDEVANIRLLLRHNDNSDMSISECSNIVISRVYKDDDYENVRIRGVSLPLIGDSMLIKFGNGQNAIIDLGHSYDFPLIKDALCQEGVKKIDYLIISHYHNDHATRQGVQSLLSNFDTTNMVAILPPDVPAEYDNQEAHSMMAGVKEALTNAGINYINTYRAEKVDMFLGEIPFTFYNCNQSDMYAANYDYNNMSMVCVMKCGKTSVLFSGDMMKDLETKLLNEIKDGVTIAMFGHHGWNQPTNVNYDFWRKMKPEVFFSLSPSDTSYGEGTYERLRNNSGQFKFANYNGIKNVTTGEMKEDIIIDIAEDGYAINGFDYRVPTLSQEEYFGFVI